MSSLVEIGRDLLTNPKHTRWMSLVMIAVEAVLCGLIITKVPYTEIDWTTYMQQVSKFINGERDYAKIHGDTGPLVYPAFHVYIYRVLHFLTDEGRDIQQGQFIFGSLYLCTMSFVTWSYSQAGVPPYILPLLMLSKRLHSIYILRLFNDCFAVFGLWLTIYFFQKRFWTLGAIAFTLGLGVKMNLLLVLPAVGIILYQALGRGGAVRQLLLIANVQILMAFPFTRYHLFSYATRAFDLSRRFLFVWTVNWRFVGQEGFESLTFARALMSLHLSLLALFLTTRWIAPSKMSFPAFVDCFFRPLSVDAEKVISRRVTPDFVLTTMLTANVVGMLCARSLHYQFYSWLAWGSPFLLWRSGLHPVLIYAVWLAQEWAWNVYPSTDISSMVVVGCLAVTVLSVWWGTRPVSEKKPVTKAEKLPEEKIL